ncbi:MAG: hypothetical protein ABII09_04075 [Planctomycetota bacterium]
MGKNAIIKEAVFCVIMLYLWGCAENKYVKTEERLCVPGATKAEAMTAAKGVLANMHFKIEKFDLEAGYIRTLPLAGAQSFELWRTDSVGGFNRAEADLHSIRRMVELEVSQQAGQLCINCNATTQRLSIASEQGSGRSYKAMTGQTSIQEISREQKSNMTWIDLGRDDQLETEILKRIEKRLSTAKKGKVK